MSESEADRGRADGDRPVVVTMGEPAGIGGEIAMAAWSRRADGLPVFAVIDDPVRLRALAAQIGSDTPVREITAAAEASQVFSEALPVLAHPLKRPVTPGHADPGNGPAVIGAIDRAVALVRAGAASAIVTNPIHKKTLYDAGFVHPGHTEYLAARGGADGRPVMMLVGGGLRVVPLTIHISLAQALASVSRLLIVETGRIVADALIRDFGIRRPRLAVAGLNPHAGEGGAFGREEIEIIAPAIADLRAAGVEATGPVPPDTMFHAVARARYDAALCMYHDQALIPLKTIAFDTGVNVTLGLPFVRTSPDHGTALDIAGKGVARPDSLIEAIRLADALGRRRARHDRRAVA
jgi:4-hydroxythreonine-4-phosphate dehydrogenase